MRNPQTPENILKNIPLFGATVLKNNHLKDGILIKSLGTSVQSIQGNREVFLITGVALNQNPVVVREIQVTGKVYNRDGKEIEHQTIWVGNTISPKIIRGMTVEDIPQLQELKPLKSFEVPPGDSMPFTIVFLKSTKNANEFTCEVVNGARRDLSCSGKTRVWWSLFRRDIDFVGLVHRFAKLLDALAKPLAEIGQAAIEKHHHDH